MDLAVIEIELAAIGKAGRQGGEHRKGLNAQSFLRPMLALSTAKPLRAFALPPRNRRFRLTLSAQIPFASGVQARSGRRQVLVEALPSWQNIGLQEISMNITDLNKVALAMVAPGK